MPHDPPRDAALAQAIDSLIDAAARLGVLHEADLDGERSRAAAWAAARRASAAATVIDELIVTRDREQAGRRPIAPVWSGRVPGLLRILRREGACDPVRARDALDGHQQDLEVWDDEIRRHRRRSDGA